MRRERRTYLILAKNWLGLLRPILTIKTNLHWSKERLRRIARQLGGVDMRLA
jgi:hypothetical protein